MCFAPCSRIKEPLRRLPDAHARCYCGANFFSRASCNSFAVNAPYECSTVGPTLPSSSEPKDEGLLPLPPGPLPKDEGGALRPRGSNICSIRCPAFKYMIDVIEDVDPNIRAIRQDVNNLVQGLWREVLEAYMLGRELLENDGENGDYINANK